MAKELLIVRSQNYGDSVHVDSRSMKLGKGITVRLHEANYNGHLVCKEGTIAGLAMIDIVLLHQESELLTQIPIPLNEPIDVEDVMEVSLRIYGNFPPDSQWTMGAHLIYEWLW